MDVESMGANAYSTLCSSKLTRNDISNITGPLWGESVCDWRDMDSRDPFNHTSQRCSNWLLTRCTKLWVTHTPGMPGTFSPQLQVSYPGMQYGTCVTHVPRWMLGSLTSGFLWSRWRGKRSQHSGACATGNFAYLVSGPLANGICIRNILPRYGTNES